MSELRQKLGVLTALLAVVPLESELKELRQAKFTDPAQFLLSVKIPLGTKMPIKLLRSFVSQHGITGVRIKHITVKQVTTPGKPKLVNISFDAELVEPTGTRNHSVECPYKSGGRFR